MASLTTTTTVTVLLLALFLSLHLSLSAPLKSRRSLALMEEDSPAEDEPRPPPKKKPVLASKNQTKPIKPKKPTTDDEEEEGDHPISESPPPKKKPILGSKIDTKNQTKLLKPKKPSNSTTIPKLPKPSNSTTTTKPKLNSTKKSNSTTTKPQLPKPIITPAKLKPPPLSQTPIKNSLWDSASDAMSDEDGGGDGEGDLLSDFRALPTRLHQTLLPDLQKLSYSSKAYISRANLEIANGVKPYVGHRFAPKIAAAASCALLLLPLLLVAALFRRLSSYLSLQRFLIFAQAYLAIYFGTLALTAVVTGLEPLRFFYAASPASYAWTQAAQTMGYVLYLVAQLANLVVVFSAGGGGGGEARALGLAQMVVGLAVGMHYYAAVFHRAVSGEPPKATWKVHAAYAACFLLILGLARAERRKKAYLPVDGGDEGKKS